MKDQLQMHEPPRKNSPATGFKRIVAAFDNSDMETLQSLLLGLYESFLEYRAENLTIDTNGWDKLVALIEKQAVSGFDVRTAAGMLKVLIVSKCSQSYEIAGRKTAEFSPQVRKEVRLVLADALDDCFATGDVATWVAFNYECINDQVIQTIRLLDRFCLPNDKIALQLHASKLFFAANDLERQGGFSIIRVLCDVQWLAIFKDHEKYQS
jgi:hypothetical protein